MAWKTASATFLPSGPSAFASSLLGGLRYAVRRTLRQFTPSSGWMTVAGAGRPKR
jgi:hypothetical protein